MMPEEGYQVFDDVDVFRRRSAVQRRPAVRVRCVDVGADVFDEIPDDVEVLGADGVVQRSDAVVVGLGRVGQLGDGLLHGLQFPFQGRIQLERPQADLFMGSGRAHKS